MLYEENFEGINYLCS